MKNIIYSLFLFFIFQVVSMANTQVPAENVTSQTTSFHHCLGNADTNVQSSLNDIDTCLGNTQSTSYIDSVVKSNGNVSLVNDQSSPSASQYYGTDGLGVLGYHTILSGGNVSAGTVGYDAVYTGSTTVGSGSLLDNGNIGIGSPNPGTILDVVGTLRTTALNLNTTTSSGYILTSDATGNGTWQPAPATTTFANPTANVGTTAVNGSATTAMRSDAAPAINQSMSPTWTGNHIFAPTTGNTIFSQGNVGIGTPTPLYALHVAGNQSGGTAVQASVQNISASGNSLVSAVDNQFNSAFIGIGGSGAAISNPYVGSSDNSLYLLTNGGTNVPVYLVGSNVGLGTSKPGSLFSIGVGGGASATGNAFNINSSGNFTTCGGVACNFNAAGLNMQNQNGAISFGNYDTAGTHDITRIYNADATGSLRFSPSSTSTDLVTIDSAGNLGIGTTLPAYTIDEGTQTIQTGDTHFSSPTIGMVCQNGCFLDGNGGGPVLWAAQNRNIGINNSNPQYQLDVTGNIHSTGLTISGNGASTGYIWTATDSAGDGNWQANAGGAPTWSTSGSNIYNANAGNVGIGTINPTAALQVNGTITGSTFIGVNPAAIGDWPSTIAAPYTCTTNYYVNPSVSGASDSNNGTSLTTPFLTINGAITAVQAISNLQGNTCINVSPGAYSEATGGYTSIGGTRNWTFTVSSANATVGATYTNNNITFTVAATIASQTTLTATTPSAYFPYTSGTLTKASGTGDSTITYSAATAGTINYFTIRSTLNRQAIITIPTADAGSYVDCFRFDNSNFWVVDGFVCNGADSVAASNDSGVSNNGSNSFDSHVQIINGTWDHLGAAGIGINHFDYLTIAGNLVYHNADQNYTYNIQGSGISMYQDVASDGLTTPHNYIYGNVSRGNFIGPGNTNAHSDGNGIIIDDLAFDQNSCTSQPKLDITASGGFISSAVPHSGNAGSGCQVGNVLIVNQSGAIAEFIVATLSGSAVATVGNPITLNQGSGFTTASAVTTTMAYVYQTNIYNNVTHDNGGGGIHVFDGGYTLSYNNTDYNEYTDLLNTSTTGRAGINCSDTTNCQFINNIAVTNPYVPGSLGYNGGNTACGDYNYSGSNSGDVWENNDCYAGLGGYSYIFTISSASASSGATYTNNSCTFTVVSTISSGTLLQTTGTCNPTASGTLTKASGTGGSTITFSAVSNTFSVYTLGASSTTWSNNIGAAPGFVNKAAFNYRLNAGSPAIGTGLNENLTTDADGKVIVPGAGYDMGAYQTNTISGSVALGQNLSANATTFTGNSSITGQLLQSGGNVGIGTVTPGTLLDVQGTARTLGVVITGTANGCGTFSGGVLSSTGSACGGSGSTPGGGQNAVQYNNSSTFTGAENVFSFNGTNVGIGTTNGLALFDVRGTTNIFSLNDSSFGNVGIGTSKANTLLQVGTGANGFQVNTAGNIAAIGNSTSATLSSNTLSLTNSGAAISLNNGSSTSGSGTTIKGSQATNGFVSVQSTGGVGAGDFIKFIGGNNGGTEIGRMLGLGYVGIGTAAPGSALDVNGTLLNGLRFNGNVGIGTVTASTGGLQIGTDSAQVTIGTMLCVGTGNCVGQCTGTVVGDSCTTCTCLPK